jgi:hypothetical protein
MILFGAACFPLYSYRDGAAPPELEAWLRRMLLAAAIAALTTGISGCVCNGWHGGQP